MTPRCKISWAITIVSILIAACQINQDEDFDAQVPTFRGLYYQYFEISSFVPCGEGEPGYGEGYWIDWSGVGNSSFFERYKELQSQHPELGGPSSSYVYVVFAGRLSESGHFGHLGGYDKEIAVTRVIEMTRADSCP